MKRHPSMPIDCRTLTKLVSALIAAWLAVSPLGGAIADERPSELDLRRDQETVQNRRDLQASQDEARERRRGDNAPPAPSPLLRPSEQAPPLPGVRPFSTFDGGARPPPP